ncbi:MAG: potassium channel protein [Lentisphaerales bacterium]|nr:potassium channel protein [Lentisphaerales bacterium]
MSASIKSAVVGVLVLASWTVLGTVGFCLIEGWSILQSLYMTVITISTVGYGEPQALSDGGKAFAMVLIIGGWASSVHVLACIGQLLFDGGFFDILGEKKRFKKIMELDEHYIVCGYGRMGNGIVEGLLERNEPFVIIDSDPSKEEEFKAHGLLYIIGDATQEEILKEAGAEKAKSLLALLPSDADNLYLAIAAKELNPNLYLISQALYDIAEKRLRKSGVDQVISPYKVASHYALHAAVSLSPVRNVELGKSEVGLPVSIREVIVEKGTSLADKTIIGSKLQSDYGVLVVGIKKETGDVLISPSPNDEIHEGDILVLAGENTNISKVQALCS